MMKKFTQRKFNFTIHGKAGEDLDSIISKQLPKEIILCFTAAAKGIIKFKQMCLNGMPELENTRIGDTYSNRMAELAISTILSAIISLITNIVVPHSNVTNKRELSDSTYIMSSKIQNVNDQGKLSDSSDTLPSHKNVANQTELFIPTDTLPSHKNVANQTELSNPMDTLPSHEKVANQTELFNPTDIMPPYQNVANQTELSNPTNIIPSHQNVANQTELSNPTDIMPSHQNVTNLTEVSDLTDIMLSHQYVANQVENPSLVQDADFSRLTTTTQSTENLTTECSSTIPDGEKGLDRFEFQKLTYLPTAFQRYTHHRNVVKTLFGKIEKKYGNNEILRQLSETCNSHPAIVIGYTKDENVGAKLETFYAKLSQETPDKVMPITIEEAVDDVDCISVFMIDNHDQGHMLYHIKQAVQKFRREPLFCTVIFILQEIQPTHVADDTVRIVHIPDDEISIRQYVTSALEKRLFVESRRFKEALSSFEMIESEDRFKIEFEMDDNIASLSRHSKLVETPEPLCDDVDNISQDLEEHLKQHENNIHSYGFLLDSFVICTDNENTPCTIEEVNGKKVIHIVQKSPDIKRLMGGKLFQSSSNDPFFGTLGSVVSVVDRRGGFGLTCEHVMPLNCKAYILDHRNINVLLGKAVYTSKTWLESGENQTFYDFSVIELTNDVLGQMKPEHYKYVSPNEICHTKMTLSNELKSRCVYKRGAKTELTKGIVLSNAMWTRKCGDKGGPKYKRVIIARCFEDEGKYNFADEGDSGSIVFFVDFDADTRERLYAVAMVTDGVIEWGNAPRTTTRYGKPDYPSSRRSDKQTGTKVVKANQKQKSNQSGDFIPRNEQISDIGSHIRVSPPPVNNSSDLSLSTPLSDEEMKKRHKDELICYFLRHHTYCMALGKAVQRLYDINGVQINFSLNDLDIPD